VLGIIGADVIDQELPVGQAEMAFAKDGGLLDPGQRAALAELVGVLAARTGAELVQTTGAARRRGSALQLSRP
jgi:chromate reductase